MIKVKLLIKVHKKTKELIPKVLVPSITMTISNPPTPSTQFPTNKKQKGTVFRKLTNLTLGPIILLPTPIFRKLSGAKPTINNLYLNLNFSQTITQSTEILKLPLHLLLLPTIIFPTNNR